MARKKEGMNAKLFEDTKKRFHQILEYTVIGNTIDEGGEDNSQEEMPQDTNQSTPQDTPAADGGMDGGQMSPMEGGADQMGGQDIGQQEQPASTPEGFSPQDDMTQDDFNGRGEQPGEGDDVVDITDLTDAQKETDKNIENLDNKFGAIMKQLGAFETLIKNNDDKIEDLKAEFERRNPSQIEKMSMNTAKGGPFTVSPEEYWDEKEATSNYRTEDDDNGKEQGQYVITADDVNGAVDWHNIAKSLGDDFIMHQTLSGALKI